MPGAKTILKVATVTMATMFLMNTLAANSPRARRIIRGSSVSSANVTGRASGGTYV